MQASPRPQLSVIVHVLPVDPLPRGPQSVTSFARGVSSSHCRRTGLIDDDASCADTAHCDADVCTADVANGSPCDEDSDCISGFCEPATCRDRP